MANKKTSAFQVLPGTELVPSDRVVVLDRSATSGPGSGPEGTLKTIEADRLASFGSTKGVVRNIRLTGIDVTQSLLTWVAQAINTHGPYYGNVGEDFYFRTHQMSNVSLETVGGSGPNISSITIMYFKLLNGALVAGGPGNTISGSNLVLAGGPYTINSGGNPALFLDIGDAGAGPVHTYFNLGKDHIAGGDPWIIDGQQFLTGRMDGAPKLWQFLAGDGHWGGSSGNVTIPANFVDLSAQPPAPGFFLTKIHNLSLVGIDTSDPELLYISNAVDVHGPFTCLPGQQMVFKTRTNTGVPNTIVERYYRLIPNYTSVGRGGSVATILAPHPSWFMPDGVGDIESLNDASIIAELGDIGFGPVEDAFNLGDVNGDAWNMFVRRFVRATLGGEVIIWAFVGSEGMYGGSELGTNTAILEAIATDFFNITDEPVLPAGDTPTLQEVIDQSNGDAPILQGDAGADSKVIGQDASGKLVWMVTGTELTADELAGIQSANGLSASNPVATMDDLPTSSGVQSVTGDGIGGTPEHVVIAFPTPAEIGALASIADKSITFQKIQDVPKDTILGRIATGNGSVKALTVAEVKAMLAITGDNISTANLTWLVDRIQNLGTKKLSFFNGRFLVPALEMEIKTADSIPNKIWNNGNELWYNPSTGIPEKLVSGAILIEQKSISTTNIDLTLSELNAFGTERVDCPNINRIYFKIGFKWGYTTLTEVL